MHRSLSPLVLLSLTASALATAPQAAQAAAPAVKAAHLKPVAALAVSPAPPPAPPCTKAPVLLAAGEESATVVLTQCDGKAAAAAVDQVSLLARPNSSPKPGEPTPGVDPRLVERLAMAADHFRKDGQTLKIVLVSGIRPKNFGSFHSAGRALDIRIEGVSNQELVTFCKTLPDTGCGYYPHNAFMHIDVRNPGTGHVAWVDASTPGETARLIPALAERSSQAAGQAASVDPADSVAAAHTTPLTPPAAALAVPLAAMPAPSNAKAEQAATPLPKLPPRKHHRRSDVHGAVPGGPTSATHHVL